jgi:hypothetical protein
MLVGEYIVVALTPAKNVLARVVKVDKDKKKYQAVLEKDAIDGSRDNGTLYCGKYYLEPGI